MYLEQNLQFASICEQCPDHHTCANAYSDLFTCLLTKGASTRCNFHAISVQLELHATRFRVARATFMQLSMFNFHATFMQF